MNQIDQNNQVSYNEYKPMTVGDWLVTFIIQSIPLINLIMLFVWAFGGNTHPSKKTYAQAALIFVLIVFLFLLFFFSAIMSFFMAIFNNV